MTDSQAAFDFLRWFFSSFWHWVGLIVVAGVWRGAPTFVVGRFGDRIARGR